MEGKRRRGGEGQRGKGILGSTPPQNPSHIRGNQVPGNRDPIDFPELV